jgi:type 1 glutamine amidotransferase
MRTRWLRFLALVGLCAGPVHAQAAQPAQSARPAQPAPAQRLAAFKGSWSGPTRVHLPGPGPRPGQSLADYFAHLPSGDRHPTPLHVLVLGGSRGFHHDSIPAAMDMIYQAGRRTSLWQTQMATDFRLVNDGGGKPMHAGFQPAGLRDFDAVVIASATGDWGLSESQKKALLGFVHDEGRGLVVIHAGLDANHGWRDYIDMVGAEMTGHPFNSPQKVLVPFAIVNESPDFPIVQHLPHEFVKQDEIYVLRNFSRSDIDVLLRLDEQRLDYRGLTDQVPPDHDFPVAWVKRYGRGRVFASSLGHAAEAFEDPDIVQMYTEAVEWTLGLVIAAPVPHPRPALTHETPQ